MNLYNDIDPKVCAWIKQLIKCGLIPPGDVVCDYLQNLKPNELKKYTQVHICNGISGWPYALSLAGWPTDRPVWTASLPCQPFSNAGKQKAQKDERHLWPDFFRLIREFRPDVVFGEQVEGAIKHGWLDGVQADLERESYAVGHCVLGAHSVGAPHIRQRLYWVGNSHKSGRIKGEPSTEGPRYGNSIESASGFDGRADGDSAGFQDNQGGTGQTGQTGSTLSSGNDSRVAKPTRSEGARFRQQQEQLYRETSWDSFELITCRDGKTRRTQSGVCPLAHGVPGRVGLLRGYGNAIVPQVAAEFIKAFKER